MSDLDRITSAVEAALAERGRLLALSEDLVRGLRTAEIELAEAMRIHQAAEADCLLAADQKAAGKQADQARGTVERITRQIDRTRAAMAALPAKLLEVDSVIEEQGAELTARVDVLTADAVAQAANGVRAAAAALASALASVQALSTLRVGGCAAAVADTLVPNPAIRGEFFLRNGCVSGDANTDLRSTWWDHPEAAALHKRMAPLAGLADRVGGQLQRIAEARANAVRERNSRPMAERTSHLPAAGGVFPPREDYVAPKGTFVPHSYEIRRLGSLPPRREIAPLLIDANARPAQADSGR